MRDARTEVAIACRALAGRQLGSGIGGHVSRRDGSAFWVNRVDRSFPEIQADGVLRIDIETGEVLDGGAEPSPGITFHNAIYRARPDVGAIVHTHAPWISALAAMRRPLRMLNIRSTLFYDDLVVSPDDELASVAPTLGSASTLLVPYHGAITVGSDVGRAIALHVSLEEAAAVDVRLAGIDVPPMSDEEAAAMKKIMESATYLDQTWDLLCRQAG
jgi:L-fuculose-phosphate aldolase